MSYQTLIGGEVNLPLYIKNSRSIQSLTHWQNNLSKPYKDNACLFRCLALHKGGNIRALEKMTEKLRLSFEKYTEKSWDRGVAIEDLTEIELFFKVSINVYELREDGGAVAIRLSNLKYPEMYLNKYEQHFSYICKFKTYAKSYQCGKCRKIFNRTNDLKRHSKTCKAETEEVYMGGKYQNKATVHERIQRLGYKIAEADRFNPLYSTYDFEALQVPVECETLGGRKICYNHEPVSFSICSSVPGCHEPVHVASSGNPQELCDKFVEILLSQSKIASKCLREKYADAFKFLEAEIATLTAKKERASGAKPAQTEATNDAAATNDVAASAGEKRKGASKSKKKSKKRCKSSFIDEECEASSDEEGDEDDAEGDSDIEGLIDDSEEVDDDPSLHRALDNEMDSAIDESITESEDIELSSDDDAGGEEEGEESGLTKIEEKRLKRLKSALSSLAKYCDALIVLGFNGQKYDIPLIKKYLPISLDKLDALPKFVVKKNGGYMALGTPSLKFLDMCNFLAAGTSLDQFYKSYSVQVPKAKFPYQWFDSVEKLNATALPGIEAFYSVLTNQAISEKDYAECLASWRDNEMETFGDFVRFYNNCDVIGFVEAAGKMFQTEKENGLDLFHEGISLPGLTQRYLFKNLNEKEYFCGFGKEHKHLHKELRESVVGGPSIIFHRYHEAGVTRIKGDLPCRSVIGFDANSLYLYCLAQKQCTGYYKLREKKNGYAKQEKYSRESLQWLDYVAKTTGAKIRHATNHPHGEKRIDDFSVDGFDEETKTCYCYHGCYVHGHDCSERFNNPKKWQKTKDREQKLRDLGFNVVSMTSCVWFSNPASKDIYQPPEPKQCTMEDIIEYILSGQIFGLVKCSLKVPDHRVEYFSEFPPIFKNTEIKLEDVGEHMQEHCKKTGRKRGVKRSLISSMSGEGLVLLTPLLIKYIELGLEVTDIEFVL